MLEQITPLILTYNEAPNIVRTLEALSWARDVVVVDSFSEDETLEILARYPQVRVFQRKFSTHESQWNFGLHQTGIRTDWILALDADYTLTQGLIDELATLRPTNGTRGYRARFTYCVKGRRLRSGLYPPVTVLYHRQSARYMQDGHTQRIAVDGDIEDLSAPILHDDRKPIESWVLAQLRYTSLEKSKLLLESPDSLSWTDRIRRMRLVAPVAMLFYCLIVRRGIFDGWAGFDYAFQRMIAEAMLSVQLLEDDLAAPEMNGRQQLAVVSLLDGNGLKPKHKTAGVKS